MKNYGYVLLNVELEEEEYIEFMRISNSNAILKYEDICDKVPPHNANPPLNVINDTKNAPVAVEHLIDVPLCVPEQSPHLFQLSAKATSTQSSSSSTTNSPFNINSGNSGSSASQMLTEQAIVYCHELLQVSSDDGYGSLSIKPGVDMYLIQHTENHNVFCFVPADKWASLTPNDSKADSKLFKVMYAFGRYPNQGLWESKPA